MVNHSFAQKNITLKLDNPSKTNFQQRDIKIYYHFIITSWWFIDAANETYLHFSSQPVFA